ncbi:phage portal protein [Microbacterium hominis]|uniref:phage portal protein n=1 Tax=Microbacterium hominis TaxID=162426 RepID=UPI00196231C5|nr:phage portal protein [Microbacterium hominis]QRY40853.1 phage portal protein [Microbacterium hominis]
MISVFRAVQVISTSCQQLSFDAYRGDEEITPKPQLLRRPDPTESLGAFVEKTALSLVLNGNAFWRVVRDNQGRVVVLRVLNPSDVTITKDADGAASGYLYKDRSFSLDEIQHLSHLRVPGDPRGRGPIQAAQAELRGALDARDYSANWFQESGVPTGLLSNKGTPLPDPMLADSKSKWIESQGGQRGPAVLNGDWSWTPVYLSPEDAQWIAVRQFDTTAIARLFGIPAALMLAAVEGSSMTYSNISQAWVEFYRFTLIRYVQEIEDAFSAVLPRGTEVKANVEALLRPDSVTRYQQHALALQAGFLSINEVRAIEGLPPAPDGDFKTAEQKIAEQQAFAPSAPTEEPKGASDE